MKQDQLCRISLYLFCLDTYLFREPGREAQRQEIAELQNAITRQLSTKKRRSAGPTPSGAKRESDMARKQITSVVYHRQSRKSRRKSKDVKGGAHEQKRQNCERTGQNRE